MKYHKVILFTYPNALWVKLTFNTNNLNSLISDKDKARQNKHRLLLGAVCKILGLDHNDNFSEINNEDQLIFHNDYKEILATLYDNSVFIAGFLWKNWKKRLKYCKKILYPDKQAKINSILLLICHC